MATWAEFHTQERLLKEWLWHDMEQSQQMGSSMIRLHCSGASSYGLQQSLSGSGIDPAGRGDIQHFLQVFKTEASLGMVRTRLLQEQLPPACLRCHLSLSCACEEFGQPEQVKMPLL